MSSAPIVDRIRIIPRPEDFLDRNIGSSGELFFNKETGSLRAYDGTNQGGAEIAKADLSNIDNDVFAAKVTESGFVGSGDSGGSSFSGDYNDLVNKPNIPSSLTDLNISDGSNGQVLTTDGSGNFSFTTVSGVGGGDANQNAFSIVSVTGQTSISADTTTDTLNIVPGTGINITTDPGTDTLTIISTVSSGVENFLELTDATTAGINVGNFYEHAVATYRLDNTGVTAFTINSHYTGNNPTIYALSGTTIAFDLNQINGHPIQIEDPTGSVYNTGIVHVATDGTVTQGAEAQGQQSGILYWRIPESISGTYRYQCIPHPAMFGGIVVKRLSVV